MGSRAKRTSLEQRSINPQTLRSLKEVLGRSGNGQFEPDNSATHVAFFALIERC
jgi:hypothetical protein